MDNVVAIYLLVLVSPHFEDYYLKFYKYHRTPLKSRKKYYMLWQASLFPAYLVGLFPLITALLFHGIRDGDSEGPFSFNSGFFNPD